MNIIYDSKSPTQTNLKLQLKQVKRESQGQNQRKSIVELYCLKFPGPIRLHYNDFCDMTVLSLHLQVITGIQNTYK